MSQLKVNSIVPVGGLPSGANGGIIQVIQAVKVNTFTHSSTTFTKLTGLEITITPSSNANKILLVGQISVSHNQNNFTSQFQIRKGGNTIAGALGTIDSSYPSQTACTASGRAQQNDPETVVFQYLDSPSTTSATDYAVFVAMENNGNLAINYMYENSNQAYYTRNISTLTAYEVSV